MKKIKKTNPQDINFDIKQIFNELKNFKYLIIFITIFGIILSSIFLNKSNKTQIVEFQLFTPSVSNYLIFEDPTLLDKKLNDTIVRNLIKREWIFREKFFKKYEKNFNDIKIENKEKSNLKFISKLSSLDENYDEPNFEKLLEYIDLAINISKDDLKYEYMIYFQNKILLHEEALEIAIKSEIKKPIVLTVLKGLLMTGTPVTENSPDYYKGYDVLKVEIKHLKKRNEFISNYEFPITTKIISKKDNVNNNYSFILGGGLLSFFISLLLISLISMKKRY